MRCSSATNNLPVVLAAATAPGERHGEVMMFSEGVPASAGAPLGWVGPWTELSARSSAWGWLTPTARLAFLHPPTKTHIRATARTRTTLVFIEILWIPRKIGERQVPTHTESKPLLPRKQHKFVFHAL